MPVDYTKSAAESIADYNARTKAAQTDTSGGDFMSTLQQSLLNNQAVSSQDTGIETMINDSISKLQGGNESSKAAISSAFDRQKGYTAEAQQQTRTSTLEAGRGGAVGISALKEMDVLDRREIADLESRKQELILQGDAATAKEVSGLIIQKYQFRQQAQQQVFSNLLGIGNLAIQSQQEQRLAQTQSFAEQSAINSIALKYGLKIDKGETLDTITAKASPFASEEQRLEIQKTKSEINKANAEASKALQGEPSTAFDPTTISVMASAALSRPEVLGTIKNPQQLSLVINEMTNMQKPRDFKPAELSTMISGAGTRGSAIAGIAADPRIKNKQDALKLVDQIYGAPDNKPFTIFDVGTGVQNLTADAVNGAIQFFGGSGSTFPKI